MKGCLWQELHPHSTASEAVVSAVGLHRHREWQPQVESHHQPSGSKPDALTIELQG